MGVVLYKKPSLIARSAQQSTSLTLIAKNAQRVNLLRTGNARPTPKILACIIIYLIVVSYIWIHQHMVLQPEILTDLNVRQVHTTRKTARGTEWGIHLYISKNSQSPNLPRIRLRLVIRTAISCRSDIRVCILSTIIIFTSKHADHVPRVCTRLRVKQTV